MTQTNNVTAGTDPILVQHFGEVAVVAINRPNRRNALTPDLAPDLRAIFRGLHEDETCRAIVLTGVGSAFCAGTDMGIAAERFAGPVSRTRPGHALPCPIAATPVRWGGHRSVPGSPR